MVSNRLSQIDTDSSKKPYAWVVGYFELFFSTHGKRCKYTPNFDPFLKKEFPGPFGAI